jgi:hypothetical protein
MRRKEKSARGPMAPGAMVPGQLMLRAMVLLACTALAAGCAAGSTRTSVTGSQSPPARPAPATAAPTATAGQTPKQRADADAAAILASFAVPPGATKLSGAPSVGKGVLKQPFSVPGSPDLVDDAAWWQAPGQPQLVLGWEKAHLPPWFSDDGSGSGSDGDVFFWGDDFSLPAITGVLDSRALEVTAVAAGDGKTDLRVDAQVTWIPARPASEVVPSAARAVTLSLLPNINVHTPLPGPVTITDPAKVRALAALIDGLPLFPPGAYNCPAAFGDALVLTFRARPVGTAPALAVATAELSGCEGIDFTVGATQEPALGGPDDGRPVAAQALKIAGLPWKLP